MVDIDPTKTIVPAKTFASKDEILAYERLAEMRSRSPIPEREILGNLGLYLTRVSLSRMLFMHQLYLKALTTHGVIMEFGVRWGQNLATFTTLRNIYEPYNISRKIIGFDTFEGFPNVSDKDGTSPTAQVGALSVTRGYEDYLGEVLSAHEQLGPRNHIKKHELVKGDVVETLPKYLAEHSETIIALAFFDLDLFEPTKKCLELIRPYLAKNSIVGFDELVSEEYPGETLALRDAWGFGGYEIIRDPVSPQQSYVVMG